MATLEGPGHFGCLDPSTDAQEFRSLRLTCAELRQLVDCFGTQILHIRLLGVDCPREFYESAPSVYTQLREAGAALGRYHARLSGPVLPHKLCINAKTCRTCAARYERGQGGGTGDLMAVYMAGYMSVAGVSALLARVTECYLAGEPLKGTVQSEVWYALAPHLASLAHLTLRFNGKFAPLPKARMLGMLPPSTQLRTLSIEEGAHVDREARTHFLRCAAGSLKAHPIQELRLLLRSGRPSNELLHALSGTLPSLERMHVTQLKAEPSIPGIHLSGLFPGDTFLMLRAISYQQYGNASRPRILLSELDELLRDRPRLLHVGALRVVLTAACLTKQARYEHVERAQSASAADGGLGQLSFSLSLDDEQAAWGGMQLQALPFTVSNGGSGRGQRAASAWSSSNAHWVDIRRGTEGALTRLAALLRPAPPPLPCAWKHMPLEDRLYLKYICGEDGADSAQDVAACVLEACCLLPTFTGVRVTVVGQLLRGGSSVPEASPSAPAAGQQGSSSAGLGGRSSAGPPRFDPTSDAAERACWEEFVRQLSVRAPQLLSVQWNWQGGDGAASVPPAAWSQVASSGALGAARYLHDLTTGTGASGSRL